VGIGERVRAVHLSQYCPGGGSSWAELAGNEAQAAGRRCARCRREISAGQPARRRADQDWVHGDCR
jgi:hypothetical protein